MPTEVRHILFRDAEVVVAIAEYLRKTGDVLSTSAVVGTAIRVDQGGAVGFMLFMGEDAAVGDKPRDRKREMTVPGPVLVAALILYCNGRRIPLPSDAVKTLQKFGDYLALTVSRNPKSAILPKPVIAVGPADGAERQGGQME